MFKDKEIVVTISKSIDSSMELRSKKDLIEQFISSLTPTSRIDDDWQTFIQQKKKAELDSIIKDENLNKEATYSFINNAFRDGYVQTFGILPPISLFSRSNNRTQKRLNVVEKLTAFFNRFKDLTHRKL